MLFQLGDLSKDPRALVWFVLALAIAFVVGLTFHEFCHAFSAHLLGDDTARYMGRMSLNPVHHLDPLGTLMILFIGFGWAKPTPVNPRNLRNGPRAGMAWVSLAGPLSNFALAAVAAIPLKLQVLNLAGGTAQPFWSANNYVAYVFFVFVWVNVLLGLFNLIPLAPLDGTKIFVALFPGEIGDFLTRLEVYGPGVLFALIFVGYFIPGLDIFNKLILPLEDRILTLLLG